MSKKLLIGMIVLLVAVCGVSTYFHIKNKMESEENKKTYETVAAEVAATEDSTAVSATEAAVNPYTDNTVSGNSGTGSEGGNYQSYTTTMNASANPDMVGWIKINDTNINYPVMQTKSKNGCCTAISVLNDDTCVQFENSKMIACPYAMRALFSSARNNDLLFRMINYFRDTNTNSFTAKLKYLRQYRKMTQKELGMKIGFPEKSAGVRIAQYESGTRLPKIERMDKIADALDFPHSVFRTLTTVEVMILLEVLPQLEERFGKDYALLKLIGNKTTQTIYDWLSIYPKYFEDKDTNEDNDRWSNTIMKY